MSLVEFIKHCRIKGLSPHTVDFYIKELKQSQRAYAEIEESLLQDVRLFQSHHVEQFIEYQQSLGRAVSTINSRLRAGHTFFEFCLRKEYISKNPHEGVSQLKARHEIGPTFTKRQFSTITQLVFHGNINKKKI